VPVLESVAFTVNVKVPNPGVPVIRAGVASTSRPPAGEAARRRNGTGRCRRWRRGLRKATRPWPSLQGRRRAHVPPAACRPEVKESKSCRLVLPVRRSLSAELNWNGPRLSAWPSRSSVMTTPPWACCLWVSVRADHVWYTPAGIQFRSLSCVVCRSGMACARHVVDYFILLPYVPDPFGGADRETWCCCRS